MAARWSPARFDLFRCAGEFERRCRSPLFSSTNLALFTFLAADPHFTPRTNTLWLTVELGDVTPQVVQVMTLPSQT